MDRGSARSRPRCRTSSPGAQPVTAERITIHGKALEGNLEGDAVDRAVLVFLPPSYARERSRRYPVVYALHGYSIGAEQWSQEIHVPQTIEGAFALGAKEMIVVLPDSKTVHNGSMYSSSVTTGDFETFIARDVVSYIDAHYRTIANRNSRGLVGHSMGGYGASRVGMKHAGRLRQPLHHEPVLSLRTRRRAGESGQRGGAGCRQVCRGLREAALRAARAARRRQRRGRRIRTTRRSISTCRSAPNQQSVLARWAANAPLAFIDQYIHNLRQYRAIAIDVGDQDNLKVDTGKLHDVLNNYGIKHDFEIYSGTHTSHVAVRFQDHVMPFFSRTLSFEAAKR